MVELLSIAHRWALGMVELLSMAQQWAPFVVEYEKRAFGIDARFKIFLNMNTPQVDVVSWLAESTQDKTAYHTQGRSYDVT